MSLSAKDIFNKCTGLIVSGTVAAAFGYLAHKAGVQGDMDIALLSGAAATVFGGIGIANTVSNFMGRGDGHFVDRMADEPVLSI